jgi:putative peptidoglycan lipid II flippase
LQAALLLSLAYFLARVTGLAQYAIINNLLPRPVAAAYYAAFNLPDLVNYLVAGGAMSITFIPIFTHLKQQEDDRAAWRFFSTVATLMGLVLLIVIGLTVIFAEQFVRLTTPGFAQPGKEKTLLLTVEMTKVLLPAQLFFYLGGMVVGVLNAHKRFGVTGFTGVVYNVVAIAVGFLVWIFVDTGFAWGILIGAFLGNFLMPLISSLTGPDEERLRYSPCLDWKQPAVKRFFTNALPIMLGVSLPVVDQVVVRFFASGLNEAAFANLTTGNRFMLAPLGIVAQAASVAAFPYLAADSAAQEWTKFSSLLRSGLRRLMFLTLPVSVWLILIAQPTMRLLIGGQFKIADADQTALAFACYCVGLFAWAGQQFVARGFYAIQDTRTPTIIGSVLTIVFFIPLCWLMSFWGVFGLAMATSIGATAHFAGVTLALDRLLKTRRYNAPLRLHRILGTMVRSAAACGVMLAVGIVANYIVWKLLPATSAARIYKGSEFLRIMLVSLAAFVAFGVAAQKFRIPEWFWLRDKVMRRFKR